MVKRLAILPILFASQVALSQTPLETFTQFTTAACKADNRIPFAKGNGGSVWKPACSSFFSFDDATSTLSVTNIDVSGLLDLSLTQGAVLFGAADGGVGEAPTLLLWDGSGLCIGCNSPAASLQVSGGHILLDNNFALRGKRSGGLASTIARIGSGDFLELFSPQAGAGVDFLSSGSALLMRIEEGGEVGVGVAPSNRFEVKSASLASSPAVVDASDGSALFTVREDASGHGRLWVANAAGTTQIELRAGGDSFFLGDLCIGASSCSGALEVAGSAELGGLLDTDGSNFFDGSVPAGSFITGIDSTGLFSVASNAATATTAAALATDPADCLAGQLANAIDASGNLSCVNAPDGNIGSAGFPGQVAYWLDNDTITSSLRNVWNDTDKTLCLATSTCSIGGERKIILEADLTEIRQTAQTVAPADTVAFTLKTNSTDNAFEIHQASSGSLLSVTSTAVNVSSRDFLVDASDLVVDQSADEVRINFSTDRYNTGLQVADGVVVASSDSATARFLSISCPVAGTCIIQADGLGGSANAQSLDFLVGGSTRATIETDGGVVVGSPTGGSQGAGTVNAQGLFDDGSAVTDFVFEPGYSYLSMPELKAFIEANRHLPTIAGRAEWEREKPSIGRLLNQVYETVEIQALYILELEARLSKLEEPRHASGN